MNVLGIETSCDETGVALYNSKRGLLAEELYSQAAIHSEYGGVVPELASRDHIRKLTPLIKSCIQKADIDRTNIHGIAYTAGPGLVGPLLIGASVARSLAWSWKIPALAVHHLEGHLLAPLLDINPPEFPFVALLISGGHTLLIQADAIGHYKIIGETLDDAAGEAFDKTASLLGLGYPGGPQLSALAKTGDPNRFHFPRPMTDRPGLDFSFSGLKTFARNTLAKADTSEYPNIARSFQDAVADTLAIKCRRALKQTTLNRLVVAGGVSANESIRTKLKEMARSCRATVYYPGLQYCTDNGAMIALAGCIRLQAGEQEPLDINVQPRWPLDQTNPLSPPTAI